MLFTLSDVVMHFATLSWHHATVSMLARAASNVCNKCAGTWLLQLQGLIARGVHLLCSVTVLQLQGCTPVLTDKPDPIRV